MGSGGRKKGKKRDGEWEGEGGEGKEGGRGEEEKERERNQRKREMKGRVNWGGRLEMRRLEDEISYIKNLTLSI